MGNRRETTIYRHAMSMVRAQARHAVARLLSDEEGQATLEYILILAATVAGAGLMTRKILQAIDSGITTLGGQLEKDLKTGRAPTSVWTN